MFASLLLTVSRTGILTLFIMLPIVVILYHKEYTRIVLSLIGAFISSIVVVFILSPVESIDFVRSSISTHIQTRMIGLSTWLQNIKTFVIGIGLGNYPIYTGGFTPETNYVKFLAERGLIGTLLAIPLYGYIMISLLRNTHNAKYKNNIYIMNTTWFSIISSLLIGELFYDFIHIRFTWSIVGIGAIVAIQYAPNNINYKRSTQQREKV
jgi:hypothetical protein